jgi:hypothetical protein
VLPSPASPCGTGGPRLNDRQIGRPLPWPADDLGETGRFACNPRWPRVTGRLRLFSTALSTEPVDFDGKHLKTGARPLPAPMSVIILSFYWSAAAVPALAPQPASPYIRGMIVVYRPGQKLRKPRKRKPAPPRIVTAYSLQRLARIHRYDRHVAARTDVEFMPDRAGTERRAERVTEPQAPQLRLRLPYRRPPPEHTPTHRQERRPHIALSMPSVAPATGPSCSTSTGWPLTDMAMCR